MKYSVVLSFCAKATPENRIEIQNKSLWLKYKCYIDLCYWQCVVTGNFILAFSKMYAEYKTLNYHYSDHMMIHQQYNVIQNNTGTWRNYA